MLCGCDIALLSIRLIENGDMLLSEINMNHYNENEKSLKTNNTDDAIYFNFSYAALKLLGKNLYSNAANAISELVANSIDAKAEAVYVYIDMSNKKKAVIEIIDNGIGMDYSDLAEKYVWIGRNKRKDLSLTEYERTSVMGRKGIGKLAALYLSNKYYIFTRKIGEVETSGWEVNLSAYSDSDIPKLDRVNEPVHIVNDSIWSCFSHGTVIKLEDVDLRRNGEKKLEALRRVFADFYLIDSIGAKIFVLVQKDTSVPKKEDFKQVEKRIAYKNFYALFDNSGLNIASKMNKSICFTWASKYEQIKTVPRDVQIVESERFTDSTSGTKVFYNIDGMPVSKQYQLKGWIAVHSTINQTNAEANDLNFLRNTVYQPNRLRLYVRNKLAVEDFFSISPSTQTMANYIEGEISFDILDDDDLPDIATSSRQDFLADDRIELLIDIVKPILKVLFDLRNKIGKTISDEEEQYEEKLKQIEEQKLKDAEAAREKSEREKEESNRKREEAEKEREEARAEAKREAKRSQYILRISEVEDKNLLNSVHSIYNMANRVKQNLDDINNTPDLPHKMIKKLEKASTSNQRILSISKLISKAGYLIDGNDAVKEIELTQFVSEYVKSVLSVIYDNIEIRLVIIENNNPRLVLKVKQLSFVMMLDNLVGNAIKSGAEHLLVIINNTNADGYTIVFKDDGKGIDPSIKNVNSLFEFGITTTNGSGLGLYYAKKNMKELNGSISIIPNSDKGVSVILSWKN